MIVTYNVGNLFKGMGGMEGLRQKADQAHSGRQQMRMPVLQYGMVAAQAPLMI